MNDVEIRARERELAVRSSGSSRWLSVFGAVLLLLTGCGTIRTTAERGLPMDVGKIQEMIIGETTRSDVFRLLGTPHSIFEGQAEFLEAYSIPTMSAFYSHEENRYLSSLGENRYVLLYRFTRTSSDSTYVVGSTSNRIKIRTDELLLIFDKETDILSDVAYRPESTEP